MSHTDERMAAVEFTNRTFNAGHELLRSGVIVAGNPNLPGFDAAYRRYFSDVGFTVCTGDVCRRSGYTAEAIRAEYARELRALENLIEEALSVSQGFRTANAEELRRRMLHVLPGGKK